MPEFSQNSAAARPMNHVAVSVPDIDAAVKWYDEIFGFRLIGKRILHIKRSDSPDNPMFTIYGETLNEVRMAYLGTENGIGFEVFEFIDPRFKPSDAEFEYNRAGFFHICVTDADPGTLAEKVVKSGGSRIGVTVAIAKGHATCAYVKDPWGNVVEIVDMAFDRMGEITTG